MFPQKVGEVLGYLCAHGGGGAPGAKIVGINGHDHAFVTLRLIEREGVVFYPALDTSASIGGERQVFIGVGVIATKPGNQRVGWGRGVVGIPVVGAAVI